MNTIGDYKLEEVLGKGSFGTAYKAIDPFTFEPVCVKVFRSSTDYAEVKESFRAEVKAASAGFDHDNVIRMKFAGKAKFNKNEDRYYIVSELADNGELFDFVNK